MTCLIYFVLSPNPLKYIEIVAPFPETTVDVCINSSCIHFFKATCLNSSFICQRLIKRILLFIGLIYIFASSEYLSIEVSYFLHPFLSAMFLSITYGMVDTFQAALEVKQQTTGQQDY